jgi:hypothetical protein
LLRSILYHFDEERTVIGRVFHTEKVASVAVREDSSARFHTISIETDTKPRTVHPKRSVASGSIVLTKILPSIVEPLDNLDDTWTAGDDDHVRQQSSQRGLRQRLERATRRTGV